MSMIKKIPKERYIFPEKRIMEYQRIVNLLDNTPNQPTKFRTKNWVELNDDSRIMHNTNNQIKFAC